MTNTISKINEAIHILIESMQEDSILELTSLKGLPTKDAEDKVRAHYHKRLIYNGTSFFDDVYMKLIIPAAAKVLGIKEGNNDGQESYLGYDPESDTFYSGWDMFGTKKKPCVVSVKISNTGSVSTSRMYGFTGMMYPQNHRKIKATYPTLIDVRLD